MQSPGLSRLLKSYQVTLKSMKYFQRDTRLRYLFKIMIKKWFALQGQYILGKCLLTIYRIMNSYWSFFFLVAMIIF